MEITLNITFQALILSKSKKIIIDGLGKHSTLFWQECVKVDTGVL